MLNTFICFNLRSASQVNLMLVAARTCINLGSRLNYIEQVESTSSGLQCRWLNACDK